MAIYSEFSHQKMLLSIVTLVYQRVTDWWLSHPSETYAKVSWDDDSSQYILWENKVHVPNHQPAISIH